MLIVTTINRTNEGPLKMSGIIMAYCDYKTRKTKKYSMKGVNNIKKNVLLIYVYLGMILNL